jgi:hypothetical protein
MFRRDGQSHQVPPATSLMTGSGARQSRGLVGRRGRLCPSYMRVQSIEIRSGCCYASCGPERECPQLQLKSFAPGRSDRCAAARHRRRAMSFAPARRQPWLATGKLQSRGTFPVQRASCVCQSQTQRAPSSAEAALNVACFGPIFGACCRRLTGFTDIEPSKIVARKRVVTTEKRDVPRPLGRGIRAQAPKALFTLRA